MGIISQYLINQYWYGRWQEAIQTAKTPAELIPILGTRDYKALLRWAATQGGLPPGTNRLILPPGEIKNDHSPS